jgi:glycine/serine hydroxymethyltransferase
MKSADTTTCDPMQTLSVADPEVAAIIRTENKRQHNKIRLIPS